MAASKTNQVKRSVILSQPDCDAMCAVVSDAWHTTDTIEDIAKQHCVETHRAGRWVAACVPARRELVEMRRKGGCNLCGILDVPAGERCDDCQRLWGDEPWAVVWYRTHGGA
jgi:hypothetical protein